MKDILFQLDICWQLFEYHINGLTDQEAYWCKSKKGLNVHWTNEHWKVDWPETEEYSIGPSSIAWTLWHIQYWWKNALSANFENKVLQREDVAWSGSVEEAINEIRKCHNEWIKKLEELNELQYASSDFCKWPFENNSFTSIALWLNVEFMKNISEIGYGRFLYAASCE